MRRPFGLVLAVLVGSSAVAACGGAAGSSAVSAGTPAAAGSAAAGGGPPIVTWGASAYQVGNAVSDQTVRLIVHTSAGGTGLRVRLSNALGQQPVTFGRAYAGLRQAGAAVSGNRPLTFGGQGSVTVAPGDVVFSDPLPGAVPPASDLAISLYVRNASGPATGHGMALQTSYLTTGDHAAETAGTAFTQQTGSWYYLDAITVDPPAGIGSVVALGDSITDGWRSTSDRNNRWPDQLARRLADSHSTLRGVANEGISGNKILLDGVSPSALHRLDRDVLSQQGLRTVILFEGVNDLKGEPGATAAALIAGDREIIARAHAAGKCVVGATILPFHGLPGWNLASEAVRQQVNTFIRTSGEFDGTADFDAAVRSPSDHTRLSPPFDSGDHLHPSDQGMLALADAVDLNSLTCHR